MADILEAIDVLNALSAPVKIGWGLWLAGGLVLTLSYRWARPTPKAVVNTTVGARTAKSVSSKVAASVTHGVEAKPALVSSRGALIQSDVPPGVAATVRRGPARIDPGRNVAVARDAADARDTADGDGLGRADALGRDASGAREGVVLTNGVAIVAPKPRARRDGEASTPRRDGEDMATAGAQAETRHADATPTGQAEATHGDAAPEAHDAREAPQAREPQEGHEAREPQDASTTYTREAALKVARARQILEAATARAQARHMREGSVNVTPSAAAGKPSRRRRRGSSRRAPESASASIAQESSAV